tara:strand:- start:2818 stop:4407 length:1590 start_codon:yes stop_codon:yes gene_type:complete
MGTHGLAHAQGSVASVIGVVESYRMEGPALVAVIRLSAATDAASSVLKIREGVLRHLSIGYVVPAWAESTDPKTGKRVKTARAFQIREVSVVPVPADPGAVFRSEEMPEDLIETTPAAPTPAENRAAIRVIARSAGMTTEEADDMVDRDLSVTEARAEAFEAMQTRTRATPRIRTGATQDDPATVMARRADALHARVSGTAPKPEAAPYMADTLRDHARAAVEAAGISTRGMDPDQLFRAAMHTTSDFPNLLTSTGNRTLIGAYQAAQSPIKTTLARQATMADFRPSTRLKLSDVGLLEKVTESGEIKSTTRGEAAESYALDTYATQFAISRKALINNDLGAFGDWGATAGRMAAETEANLLLKLLLSNPVMGEDGQTLFHASHGNLASGTLLDVAGLDLARKAMRGMKALDGKTPINATPKYLVVGPEMETVAERLLASIYATTVADVNAFSGKLSLLVEPRITDDRYYVFADPAVLPVLEYAYLSSAQGPQMASREGWDVLGMEFRVVLDFGCGAIDWRGAYFNPGA